MRFTAASEGPIYLAIAVVPGRPDTWYTVRIAQEDVHIFKGNTSLGHSTKHLGAVGMGSDHIHQFYFVCVQHSAGSTETEKSTTLLYGKLAGDESIGDEAISNIFLTVTDKDSPLSPYFYAFGSGESTVHINDIAVTDMPSHLCGGHLIMVPDVGCAPACSLRQIREIDGAEMDWTCKQKNGTEYPANSQHVFKDDYCSLNCPAGWGAFPQETKCTSNGEFENKNSLGCVKICPALAEVNGSVILQDEVVSVNPNVTFTSKCSAKDGHDLSDGYLMVGGKFYKEGDTCSFLTPTVESDHVRYIASPSSLVCSNSTWSDPATLIPKHLIGEARICTKMEAEHGQVKCDGKELTLNSTGL